jgi:hypothetical protein
MPKLLFSLLILTSFSYSQCLEMYETHQNGAGIDILEYVYGDDNCCDEFPISFCNDGTVYYQKEDYADPTDSDNWDIISDDVALVRGNNQAIYNPITENSYITGSPSNTLWKGRPSFAFDNEYLAAGVYNIIYVPKYLPGAVGSIYSIPDNEYYDISFTSWTSGNGQGWPGGGGNGDGGGGGGGVSYWRSGPIDLSPSITSVLDISDDQGGRVYLEINRSMIDVDAHFFGIDNYTVQRFDEPNWVNLGSFGGLGEKVYYYEALTLSDSSYQDSGITGFRVIAQNYLNDYSFMSEIVYGYSVDNLAPDNIENFNFAFSENILQLTWDPVYNGDFDHYEIDKSADILFETDQFGSIITSGTSYIDLEYIEGETVYYRISALDHAGNRSAYSQMLTVSSSLNTASIKNIPTEFKLHQNYPNPFNPSTTIRYDLPYDGFVNISILDSKGRLVKTLLNKKQSPGFKSIKWNSLDKNGDAVAAGIYFYSIKTNEGLHSMKMILLK